MGHMKSPVLAGFLNFLWAGVGYIYVGRRVGFGVTIFIANLVAIVEIVSNVSSYGPFVYVAAFIAGMAFGIDAWKEATRANRSMGSDVL